MKGFFFVALALATAAAPRVPRSALVAMERSFDQRIQRANIDDPLDLLGATRGIYLEKYGAVFTCEVDLAVTAITPFRPQLSGEEKERLRQKKLARLGAVKQLMRDMMVTSATSLKTMPENEQVSVGVTFFYRAWELTNGLPSQLVLSAPRKALVDFEAGRIKAEALNAVIQEQVY
ncbi:MAG: hypothetical protein U0Q16_17275 [Bryobacteraceae bacterium]